MCLGIRWGCTSNPTLLTLPFSFKLKAQVWFLSLFCTDKPYQMFPGQDSCRKELPKTGSLGNLTQQFLKASVPVSYYESSVSPGCYLLSLTTYWPDRCNKHKAFSFIYSNLIIKTNGSDANLTLDSQCLLLVKPAVSPEVSKSRFPCPFNGWPVWCKIKGTHDFSS